MWNLPFRPPRSGGSVEVQRLTQTKIHPRRSVHLKREEIFSAQKRRTVKKRRSYTVEYRKRNLPEPLIFCEVFSGRFSPPQISLEILTSLTNGLGTIRPRFAPKQQQYTCHRERKWRRELLWITQHTSPNFSTFLFERESTKGANVLPA